MQTIDLRYPIGRFTAPPTIDVAQRDAWLSEIDALPRLARDAVQGLDDDQLDTPYRPGGWTVRQVVHHIPDSHLNAYVRCKLAFTEERPTIRPYEEALWAELGEAKRAPIAMSLALLDALHERWVAALRAADDAMFSRTLVHPEHGRSMTVDELIALYAWHGRHHVAHITGLREREGW
ncbi:MAG TPA: putative metal-dependent hydrolase [Gemmatimonadaceae bacterium]|nr:putative metal-dependent hydrolase [Gemmatimonadaceae bacterium]